MHLGFDKLPPLLQGAFLLTVSSERAVINTKPARSAKTNKLSQPQVPSQSDNAVSPLPQAVAVPSTRPGPCDQVRLEEAILRYQNAIKIGHDSSVNAAYDTICGIYSPLSFVRIWFKKYRYLYDTREDFIQDYLRVFCTALAAWKPRDKRRESRYGGTGEFKNYFWGALNHNYINMVKSDASGKRNLSIKCPICEAWCNPLSSHLRTAHADLLWDQMEEFGMAVESLDSCPFCKSHKIPRTVPCSHQESGSCKSCLKAAGQIALRKHLLSMHSTYLFERFHELYPSHVTLSPKPTTVYLTTDSDDSLNLYDMISEDGRVGQLLNYSLTLVQQTILTRIFNGASSVSYDADMYNCTPEEFEAEMDNLRTNMTLCGLEG